VGLITKEKMKAIVAFTLLISVLQIGCAKRSNLNNKTLPDLGFVASIDNDSLLYASGFKLIGETVSKTISPRLSHTAFTNNLEKIKNAKTKLYLCNVLFPAGLKIVGPEVEEERILSYLDSVFLRAEQAGVPLIVLGSGGVRRIPENYDYNRAKVDFIALCKKMAELAAKRQSVIALESLNSTETNFINTLKEATEIVKRVNHPNFRLNADIYHMMKESESPQHIIDAGDLIVHVEIAEKDKRTVPGVMGDDFRPYFEALRSIDYYGPIFIEARVGDAATEIPRAYTYLEEQLDEIYFNTN